MNEISISMIVTWALVITVGGFLGYIYVAAYCRREDAQKKAKDEHERIAYPADNNHHDNVKY